MRWRALTLAATGLLLACTRPEPAARPVILATTTSFQDTGLLDALLERFAAEGGPKVKAVAVGTGEALEMGRRGDADVLVVHAPKAEQKFMDEGHGTRRRALWHNDFVLVGPPSDPAKIRSLRSAAEALAAIAKADALFVSRGDNSGTHIKEKELFAAANLVPWAHYLSAGQGMGETLRIASEKQAYCLSDRGTFLKLKSTLALEQLMESEPPVMNPYHVIEVSLAKHPKVNAAGAKAFADFLVSGSTQSFVARFGVDRFGQPLFFPDASGGPVEPGR